MIPEREKAHKYILKTDKIYIVPKQFMGKRRG